MKRKQEQILTGYIPTVNRMSLSYVAAVAAVAHRHRSIITRIDVDSGNPFMPVTMYINRAVWEESRTVY